MGKNSKNLITSNRSVFFISDRTGITAEALGNSLLSQFEGINFKKVHMPFIDTLEKAENAAKQITEASLKDNHPALVFSTQITKEFICLISTSNCVFFDFFEAFISKMEKSLTAKSLHVMGRSHGINYSNHSSRINSVNFALNSDDGVGVKNYKDSDIILIGVSRSGKTPACLFMAMQYGIKASNYPLIEQDLATTKIPNLLTQYKNKLFGLTIQPTRLHKIRDKRMGNSHYASLRQCQSEVRQAEDIYHSNNIPFLDTTQTSIEEIAAKIINKLSLR